MLSGPRVLLHVHQSDSLHSPAVRVVYQIMSSPVCLPVAIVCPSSDMVGGSKCVIDFVQGGAFLRSSRARGLFAWAVGDTRALM